MGAGCAPVLGVPESTPARLRYGRSADRPDSLHKKESSSVFLSLPKRDHLHPFSLRGTRAPPPAKKAAPLKGPTISGRKTNPATAFTLGQLRDTFGHTGE